MLHLNAEKDARLEQERRRREAEIQLEEVMDEAEGLREELDVAEERAGGLHSKP